MKPGRKPNPNPSIRWRIDVPIDIAAQVEILLHDSFRGKTRYGSRAKLVEALLREWIISQQVFQMEYFDKERRGDL